MRDAIAARLSPCGRRTDLRPTWDVGLTAVETAAGPSDTGYDPGIRARPRRYREGAAAAPPGGARKRCFDAAAATSVLVLLLPLFCLIALAIKLSDRGPVLYRHRRIGRGGRPFDCLKFRTMVPDAAGVLQRHLAADPAAAREWDEKQKLAADPRVTALGGVLRKTSLDELPQLFNIVKGDMSVVGPRPIVDAEVAKYGDCIAHYLRSRPGLTGPWQVSGRNDVDYRTRVNLDRRYVETWSFRRDLVIIVKTVGVVVTARGCY